jgi:HKD family nuclease
MPERNQSIPGNQLSCGYDALATMLEREPQTIKAAVAFVTNGGVELLAGLLRDWPGNLGLVARGASITQPSALVRLEEMGASVSAVIGPRAQRFHPKLWLSEGPAGMDVLSGSGNLTEGGMTENDEQFELIHLGPEEVEPMAGHRLRFKTFQAHATPLEQIKAGRYWDRWVEFSARRDEIEREGREIDQTLAEEAGTPAENAQLYSDLLAIYETAKEEVTITSDDGSERPYVATRFKQAIDRGQREGTLVPVVGRIVRGPTEGFGRLAEAGRRDLMVETLVLDESKPYHHFFTAKSKELAQANLDLFESEYGGG